MKKHFGVSVTGAYSGKLSNRFLMSQRLGTVELKCCFLPVIDESDAPVLGVEWRQRKGSQAVIFFQPA